MHLLCPHCHNPIEVVKLVPWEEIACQSCGSSFRLVEGASTNAGGDVGHTIGRFQVQKTLGQGAFGTVYMARDPELDRTVAIKVPRAGQMAVAHEVRQGDVGGGPSSAGAGAVRSRGRRIRDPTSRVRAARISAKTTRRSSCRS
jgi:hypothetical protein